MYDMYTCAYLIRVGLGKIFCTNICLKQNLNMTSMFCAKKSNWQRSSDPFFLGNSSYLKKMEKTVFENWCNFFLIDSHLFFLVGGKWKLQLYCIVKLILCAIFIQLLNAARASCQELSPISPPAQNFNVLEAVKCSNRKNILTGFSQRL